MVPIHTKPPSRAYDEGWDAIFGKRCEVTGQRPGGTLCTCEPCSTDREKRLAALAELTRLTEEMGGYDTDRETCRTVGHDAHAEDHCAERSR